MPSKNRILEHFCVDSKWNNLEISFLQSSKRIQDRLDFNYVPFTPHKLQYAFKSHHNKKEIINILCYSFLLKYAFVI